MNSKLAVKVLPKPKKKPKKGVKNNANTKF